MFFEKEYNVGIRDIGLNNEITNIGMLGLLEDVACLHSEQVHLGVNDIERTHKVWLLMDWKMKMIKRPKYNQKLLLRTWARTTKKAKFYTYRDFEVVDSISNEVVCIATSKWIFFNIDTQKIELIDSNIINKYGVEEKSVFNIEELERIKQLSIEPDNQMIYKVRRSDIDVNNHVHNLYYLNFAYEVLPKDIYENVSFNNIRINYKKQIKLGDKVNFTYNFFDNKHIVEIKSLDEKILHATVELN